MDKKGDIKREKARTDVDMDLKRRKRRSERRGGLLTSTGSLIGLCLQKRSVMIVRENDGEILN